MNSIQRSSYFAHVNNHTVSDPKRLWICHSELGNPPPPGRRQRHQYVFILFIGKSVGEHRVSLHRKKQVENKCDTQITQYNCKNQPKCKLWPDEQGHSLSSRVDSSASGRMEKFSKKWDPQAVGPGGVGGTTESLRWGLRMEQNAKLK